MQEVIKILRDIMAYVIVCMMVLMMIMGLMIGRAFADDTSFWSSSSELPECKEGQYYAWHELEYGGAEIICVDLEIINYDAPEGTHWENRDDALFELPYFSFPNDYDVILWEPYTPPPIIVGYDKDGNITIEIEKPLTITIKQKEN